MIDFITMRENNFTVLLEIENEIGRNIIGDPNYQYDDELDMLMSVFSDLSHFFYDNKIRFILNINNVIYSTWDCEFSLFLESMLELVVFSNKKDVLTCQFEIFEQGVHYIFLFDKINDMYKLKFNDIENSSETVSSEGFLLELNFMLFSFYSRLVFLTQKLCPSISNSKMFCEWKNLVSREFGVNS